MACLRFGFALIFKTVRFAEMFWRSGGAAQHFLFYAAIWCVLVATFGHDEGQVGDRSVSLVRGLGFFSGCVSAT